MTAARLTTIRAWGRLLSAALVLYLVACAGAEASPRAQASIVGGDPATITDHPYQVIVSDGSFLCGGTIRDARHVITAAHCVLDEAGDYPELTPAGTLFVAYGTDDRTVAQATVDVASVSLDRRYSRRLGGNEWDAAVLTLQGTGIPASATAAAIPVADAAADAGLMGAGDPAIVTGFGAMSEDGPSSPLLRRASVPLVSDAFCGGAYGDALVSLAMVCAGQGGADSCQGDSGGPLVVDADATAAAAYRLAGIVSFGVGCARASHPGVYTEATEATTRALLTAESPAPAPQRPAILPTVVGQPRAGSTVSCRAGAVSDGAVHSYLWYSLDAQSQFRRLSSSGPTQLLSEVHVGERILCDVRYEGAGGFSYGVSDVAAAVGPVVSARAAVAPAGGQRADTSVDPGALAPARGRDQVRPLSRILRARCRGGRCVFSISATDPQGKLRSVAGRLSFLRKVCRRRAGGRRVCRRKTVSKRVRGRRIAAGRYRVSVRGLRAGLYRLSLRAVDSAGNRQAKPTSLRFRVGRNFKVRAKD